MAHVFMGRPSTLEELKLILEDFADNIKQEAVRKMVVSVKEITKICRD